jgi:hypothetical protein
MTALQGRVLSDKIAEVVLPDGKFAEIYKVKTFHHAIASHPNQIIYTAGLAAQVVVIDGKQYDVEHYLAMDFEYFVEVMKHIK